MIDENLAVMIDEYDYHPGKKLSREVIVDGKRQVKFIGPNTRLQEIVAALAETTDDLELAKTPTGKFRAVKEVIEELTRYSPFFEHLNDYRAATKLKSTYLDKMGAGGEAPVLHPSYDVLKASGRCSSFGEINAQNLPKKDGRVRRCFVPRPGNVFIDCDYKAI